MFSILNDNRVSNLEYVTPSDNRRHAYDTGLIDTCKRQGEYNANAKLTSIQVRNIRGRLATGESVRSLAARYDVSWDAIADIRDNKSWKSI